jgi:hypothetical protein
MNVEERLREIENTAARAEALARHVDGQITRIDTAIGGLKQSVYKRVERRFGRRWTFGPDFICIGAQRSGTSWLYWNLLWHPDTAMPPAKEINFFYSQDRSWVARRLFGRLIDNDSDWGNRYDEWRLARRIGDAEFPFAWYHRFLFGRRTAENYRLLFAKSDGMLSGDISPSYAVMPEKGVARLHAAAPGAKIIYLLRNPVERVWSGVRHQCGLDEAEIERVLKDFARDSQNPIARHTNYATNFERWERYFGDQIQVFFFDQLDEEPERFFLGICEYLGIAQIADFPSQKMRERVNDSAAHAMPAAARKLISDRMRDETERLHARFGNEYTRRWVAGLT